MTGVEWCACGEVPWCCTCEPAPPTLGESLADGDWSALEAAAPRRAVSWPILRERYSVRPDGAVFRSWYGVLPGEGVPFAGTVVIGPDGREGQR